MTDCSRTSFHFDAEARREAVARFDGGAITSEAGALPLHRTEDKTGVPRRFARADPHKSDAEIASRTVISPAAAELVRHPR